MMCEKNRFTPNQWAVLYAMTHGYRLVNCSSGYALWDNGIDWSQGRTPENAVADADIVALRDGGYLEEAGWGALDIPFYLMGACRNLPEAKHSPTDENAYTGPAFCD